MRIVSLNIRNGDAEDGDNSWPVRQSSLTSFLEGLDADIYCLQEVMNYQLERILEALAGHEFVGVGRLDGQSEGEFAPILYLKSRFQMILTESFWLSESPTIPGSKSWGTACERLCTIAVLRADGHELLVANTHLDHISQLARERGIDLILKAMSRYDSPIRVLAGDFNAEPGNSIQQPIRAAGLCDSLEGYEESTFHDFGRLNGGRIDFIYSSGTHLTKSWIEPAAVDGRYASDHHAVVAEFES